MGKRRRLLYADACGLGRRGLRGDERRGGPALWERLGRGACAAGARSQRAADASRKCCWKAGRDGTSAPRMARMRRRARVRGVNVDRPKRSRMAITAWAASNCRGDDISPPRATCATRAACMAGERGERDNCDMSSAAPKSDDIERAGETCPHVRRDGRRDIGRARRDVARASRFQRKRKACNLEIRCGDGRRDTPDVRGPARMPRAFAVTRATDASRDRRSGSPCGPVSRSKRHRRRGSPR